MIEELEGNVKGDDREKSEERKKQLEEFSERVQKLSRSLESASNPKICTILPRALRSVPQIPIGGTNASGNYVVPPHIATITPPLASTGRNVRESDRGMPTAGGTQRSAPRFEPVSLSEAAKARLKSHEQIQEGLADDLAHMAAALKENTKVLESKLRERGNLLENTEKELDKSLQGTKASVAGVMAARKSTRVNFCYTLMIFLMLSCGFAGMYIFIRMTRMAGYKAEKNEL